jgi:flavin reductase (DIM6/NTAB) family NADH-FMN oxidoreductase RutF
MRIATVRFAIETTARNSMRGTSIDSERFKNLMANVAATVTVVTAPSDDGPVGITVSAFTSVSADPPIVLVCIDKVAGSLESLLGAEGFTVNFMPEGTEDTAIVFAMRGADKFGSVEWSDPVTTAAGPVLAVAFQVFECETVERTEMGDHWVMYGTVVAESSEAAVPLIYFNRDFARIA